MPNTGIFFLPPNASSSPDNPISQLIVDRLVGLYDDPEPQAKWALDHRLFRESVFEDTEDPAKPEAVRYLQVLSLSQHPGRSYVVVTNSQNPRQTHSEASLSNGDGVSSGAEAIVTIPSGAQTDEFVQVMVSRFGPLWTPRQVLQVSNGQSYDIGDFRIRFGEVRQGSGGAQQIRGTIVEVEDVHGDATVEAGISVKRFWENLSITGARDYTRTPTALEENADIRLWCEALRVRAQL